MGDDTVVFRLDPSRSHEVPEGHFPARAQVVLMVDRYSAYKAMAQVKLGNVVLVFCWSHVRRDFVTVGKAWPEHKEWALAWLWRIRDLYRYHRERRISEPGTEEFTAADTQLRQTVAAMRSQADAGLADPKLPTPCRKVLISLQEHWDGLTRFLDDLRIPPDNNASERQARGPALGRKNYYGSGALWSGRLAAMLVSLFATLNKANINSRKWQPGSWKVVPRMAANPRRTSIRSCPGRCRKRNVAKWPSIPTTLPDRDVRQSISSQSLPVPKPAKARLRPYSRPRQSQNWQRSDCARSGAERLQRSFTKIRCLATCPPEDLDGPDDYDRMLVAEMDDSRPICEADRDAAASEEAVPQPAARQAEADEAA